MCKLWFTRGCGTSEGQNSQGCKELIASLALEGTTCLCKCSERLRDTGGCVNDDCKAKHKADCNAITGATWTDEGCCTCPPDKPILREVYGLDSAGNRTSQCSLECISDIPPAKCGQKLNAEGNPEDITTLASPLDGLDSDLRKNCIKNGGFWDLSGSTAVCLSKSDATTKADGDPNITLTNEGEGDSRTCKLTCCTNEPICNAHSKSDCNRACTGCSGSRSKGLWFDMHDQTKRVQCSLACPFNTKQDDDETCRMLSQSECTPMWHRSISWVNGKCCTTKATSKGVCETGGGTWTPSLPGGAWPGHFDPSLCACEATYNASEEGAKLVCGTCSCGGEGCEAKIQRFVSEATTQGDPWYQDPTDLTDYVDPDGRFAVLSNIPTDGSKGCRKEVLMNPPYSSDDDVWHFEAGNNSNLKDVCSCDMLQPACPGDPLNSKALCLGAKGTWTDGSPGTPPTPSSCTAVSEASCTALKTRPAFQALDLHFVAGSTPDENKCGCDLSKRCPDTYIQVRSFTSALRKADDGLPLCYKTSSAPSLDDSNTGLNICDGDTSDDASYKAVPRVHRPIGLYCTPPAGWPSPSASHKKTISSGDGTYSFYVCSHGKESGRELDYPVAIEAPANYSPLSFSGSDDPSSGSGNTHHPPWAASASYAFCGPFEQTQDEYTSSGNDWPRGLFRSEYTTPMQWPVCGPSGFKPVPWLHGGRGGALKSDPSADCTPDSTNNKCLWAVARGRDANSPRILYQPLKASDRETDKGYCSPEQLAFKFNVETGEAEGSNEADKVCCPNGDCTADDDEGLNGQTDTTTDGQEHNYILPTIHSTYDNADGGGGNNGGGGNSGGGGNAGANNGVCCPITDGNSDGDTDDVATGADIDHRVPIMDYSTGLPNPDNKVCCPTGDGTDRHPNLITYTYDNTNKKANDGVGQAKVCCKPTHVAKAPSSSNTEPEADWTVADYNTDVCCQDTSDDDNDNTPVKALRGKIFDEASQTTISPETCCTDSTKLAQQSSSDDTAVCCKSHSAENVTIPGATPGASETDIKLCRCPPNRTRILSGPNAGQCSCPEGQSRVSDGTCCEDSRIATNPNNGTTICCPPGQPPQADGTCGDCDSDSQCCDTSTEPHTVKTDAACDDAAGETLVATTGIWNQTCKCCPNNQVSTDNDGNPISCCSQPVTDTTHPKSCPSTACSTVELKTCTGAGCASKLGALTGNQYALDGTGFSTHTEGAQFTVTAATSATNASWGTKTDAYMGAVCKDVSGNLVPNASFDVKIKRLSPVAWPEAKNATNTTAQHMPYGLDITPFYSNGDIVRPPATQITHQNNYIAFPCFGDRRAEAYCSNGEKCGDIKGLLLSNMEGEFEFEFNITVNGASQTKRFSFQCTDDQPTPAAVQTCYTSDADEDSNHGLPLKSYEEKLCTTRSICVNNRATVIANQRCMAGGGPSGDSACYLCQEGYVCLCVDGGNTNCQCKSPTDYCNYKVLNNTAYGLPACIKDYCDGNKAGKDHCFQGTQEACGRGDPPQCLLNNP